MTVFLLICSETFLWVLFKKPLCGTYYLICTSITMILSTIGINIIHVSVSIIIIEQTFTAFSMVAHQSITASSKFFPISPKMLMALVCNKHNPSFCNRANSYIYNKKQVNCLKYQVLNSYFKQLILLLKYLFRCMSCCQQYRYQSLNRVYPLVCITQKNAANQTDYNITLQ